MSTLPVGFQNPTIEPLFIPSPQVNTDNFFFNFHAKRIKVVATRLLKCKYYSETPSLILKSAFTSMMFSQRHKCRSSFFMLIRHKTQFTTLPTEKLKDKTKHTHDLYCNLSLPKVQSKTQKSFRLNKKNTRNIGRHKMSFGTSWHKRIYKIFKRVIAYLGLLGMLRKKQSNILLNKLKVLKFRSFALIHTFLIY